MSLTSSSISLRVFRPFAAKNSSSGFCSSLCRFVSKIHKIDSVFSPIDVAELMFCTFRSDCDIKCSTC